MAVSRNTNLLPRLLQALAPRFFGKANSFACRRRTGYCLPKPAFAPFSTHTNLSPASAPKLDSTDDSLQITWQDGVTTEVHSIWLRDNCRCPSCLHPQTFQRQINIHQVPSFGTQIQSARVSRDGRHLAVDFGSPSSCSSSSPPNTGSHHPTHRALFQIDWLYGLFRNSNTAHPPTTRGGLSVPSHPRTTTWGTEILRTLPTVSYRDVMHSDEGVLHWLEQIDRYGFSIVEGVPTATVDASREVVSRIAAPRPNIFGSFWDIVIDTLNPPKKANQQPVSDLPPDLEHEDTAYTSIALAAHTDGTYHLDSPGLQTFHFVEHTGGTGGESLLVDGFRVAEILKKETPDAYEILTTVPMRFWYVESDNVWFEAEQPIIKIDPITGDLVQFRYNNEDRVPSPQHGIGMSLATSSHISVDRIYSALGHLMNTMARPDVEVWRKMPPGSLLVTNNWRVAHGRAAFTGRRRMLGCYVGMDEFQSRLRTLTQKVRGGGEPLGRVDPRKVVW